MDANREVRLKWAESQTRPCLGPGHRTPQVQHSESSAPHHRSSPRAKAFSITCSSWGGIGIIYLHATLWTVPWRTWSTSTSSTPHEDKQGWVNDRHDKIVGPKISPWLILDPEHVGFQRGEGWHCWVLDNPRSTSNSNGPTHANKKTSSS